MTEKEETQGRRDAEKTECKCKSSCHPRAGTRKVWGVGVLKLKRGVQGEEPGPGLLRRGAAQPAWHI